jgi:hypothetical protein
MDDIDLYPVPRTNRMMLRKLLGLRFGGSSRQPQTSAQEDERKQVYDQDGLRSVHDHSFMSDPSFRIAYNRGVQAAGEYGWH